MFTRHLESFIKEYLKFPVNGRIEIDCLIDYGKRLVPIEIKASQNVTVDFFKGLNAWNELAFPQRASEQAQHSFLIYAGNQKQVRSGGNVIPWKDSAHLIPILNL